MITDVIWHRNWIRSLRRELVRTEANAEDRRVQLEAAEQALRQARPRARQGARAVARSGPSRRTRNASGATEQQAIDELATPCAARSAQEERAIVSVSALGVERRHHRTTPAAGHGRPRDADLGQDAFLKLLDDAARATGPDSSRRTNGEFIAQLAQFSSLEKLTQIETSIRRQLSACLRRRSRGTGAARRRPAHSTAARRRRGSAIQEAMTWQSDRFRPACRA